MTVSAVRKVFWKKDGFWFVVMPTSLVALVFLFAMVARASGY
jgi:hypothetical protein